ncbi:MAG: branched-chain-amino-acid transaminase [Dethiobacteria bacterium]|jgi:branched-chain amino acid aminotransferase|nr:branched-chain-amino-acid transaminase [Bacillota bacterium]
MERLVFMNGAFVPQSEAKVSVFDHGFLYGDGVFEGIRSYNGRIFKLKEHVQRLYESAHSILLAVDYTQQEMENLIIETVRRNKLKDAYIRVVISRGEGDLGLDPRKCKKSQVIIIADTITLYPEELYKEGLKVITVSTRRNIPDALDPKIKSLNYLNNILVKLQANHAGMMEAVMLNSNGYVTEGSGDNIFIYKRGRLITPPAYLGILEGITRQAVIDLARENDLQVVEEPFTRHDLYVAEECFLTGTAAELIPVVEVDKRKIGDGQPGRITKVLMQKFKEYAQNSGVEVYNSNTLK